MDPNLSWPMNIDLSTDNAGGLQNPQQTSQPQQQMNNNQFNVFMGAPDGSGGDGGGTI